ncbi:hypothetical protein Pmani_018951 [Petrolisthes manimaculis]|uniref:Uncharacterized protein n=1 Tax=Petrolisthes manimaculis TaxID=1843537 RepID=A0AAE1U894_9EUCA|nr:hypothetical protein Pmani_018951 [Petrolisthes manimaculis]
MDVAVNLLKKAEVSLVTYRNTGFADGHPSAAKEICEDMNVVGVPKQKRLRSTKSQFSYEAPDDQLNVAMK